MAASGGVSGDSAATSRVVSPLRASLFGVVRGARRVGGLKVCDGAERLVSGWLDVLGSVVMGWSGLLREVGLQSLCGDRNLGQLERILCASVGDTR